MSVMASGCGKPAVDVILPDPVPAGGLPTILAMTRYWRATEGQEPTPMQRFWSSHGSAVVQGDVRGTGASFGVWPHQRSRDETLDYGEVMSWIVARPWSDGAIGGWGSSYTANTADWMVERNHAALKAVVSRFPDYDRSAIGRGAICGTSMTRWSGSSWPGSEGARSTPPTTASWQPSMGRGVRCAWAVVHELQRLGLPIRAGLHAGECEEKGGQLGGIAVDTGARIAARARSGEALVSGTVKDLVAGSGIVFHDRGVQILEGVPGRWHLYAVASA